MKEKQADWSLAKMIYKPFSQEILKFQGATLKHLHYHSVESTQTLAKELLNQLKDQTQTWGVVTADCMTKGQTANPKGSWISPIGNLYSSFCLRIPKSSLDRCQLLPQLCSLSVCEVIGSKLPSLHPQIKWINDTLINNRKVAGVLCQSAITAAEVQLILGIGVNINTSKEDYQDLEKQNSTSYTYPATSLKIELGEETSQRAIFLGLCDALVKNISILLEKGSEEIISSVEKQLVNLEKEVVMTDYEGKELQRGIFIGLNKYGHARLKLENGEEVVFHTGRMRLSQI